MNSPYRPVLSALDGDGQVVWQVQCGPAWDKQFPGTRATPTIDGERLYYQSPSGEVVCLDAKTGTRHCTFGMVTGSMHTTLADPIQRRYRPGMNPVDTGQKGGLLPAPSTPEQASRVQNAWARRLGTDIEITNSIGMALALIPPGEFDTEVVLKVEVK